MTPFVPDMALFGIIIDEGVYKERVTVEKVISICHRHVMKQLLYLLGFLLLSAEIWAGTSADSTAKSLFPKLTKTDAFEISSPKRR
ncbi:hypothetical protein [Spirosoma sp. KUDC1026]|uniref:hypothetical protein n=1 Tax=Spirosoma sp. KUDC1026 TaxID=2745947 RepID=UPI00159B97EC|nr:hypothetical protein [Spirosoma sp. KUDC1026]QKZ11626.1 hypothetical protein HU175_02860 [Spirosoma sp. KUDC1026]